jgi:hypothetical protein
MVQFCKFLILHITPFICQVSPLTRYNGHRNIVDSGFRLKLGLDVDLLEETLVGQNVGSCQMEALIQWPKHFLSSYIRK